MITCDPPISRDLAALLSGFGLSLHVLPPNSPIPGSFWGEPEAGLVGDSLYVRADTPLHSALHEASHFICMDDSRRRQLHTDALSDDLEECGVCYLQIRLGDALPGASASQLMDDMDAWGYSFRLGSTRAWFEQDAQDALQWLTLRGITTPDGRLTGRRAA